jgi:diguanylate cyclase (GGDEF)-like protein/PAS domain S-box-containing protein
VKISLKLKFSFFLLPLALCALLYLLAAVDTYRGALGEVGFVRRQVDGALLAERLARSLEKRTLDRLASRAAGKAWEAEDREPERLLAELEKRISGGTDVSRPVQVYILGEIRNADDGILASWKDSRDPKPGLDQALARNLDRLASEFESEVLAGLPVLEGRLHGTVPSISVRGAAREVSDLKEGFAVLLAAERLATAVARQGRIAAEAAISPEADAAKRFVPARGKALDLLSAWKGRVAGRTAREESRRTGAAAAAEVEREYDRLDETCRKALLLAGRGSGREAGRLMREELDPRISRLLTRIEGHAAGESRIVAALLDAVASRADGKRMDVAAGALLLLFVGAGIPWFLFSKVVHPIRKLKDIALEVGSGRLDAKAEIPARDELGDLAASFNAMTAFIASTTISKEYMDNIVRAIASSVIVSSPDGEILKVNAAACKMLGYEEDELLGRSVDAILDRGGAQGRKRFEELVRQGRTGGEETVYRTKTGREIPVIFSGAAVRAADGGISTVVLVAQDIADRREAEEALEQTNEKLKVWVYELELRNREITLLNKLGDTLQTCLTVEEAYRCIALSAAELFPGSSGMIGVISSSRNLVEAVSAWGPAVKDGATFPPDECWALRRGRLHQIDPGATVLPCPHIGEKVPERSLCVPMVAQGETIGMIHVQMKKDAQAQAPEAREYLAESERRVATTLSGNVALALTNLKLRATLREQVTRDVLTGLFNRRYMEETLIREISRARRSRVPIGIIMLDIDHFKRFNDTFGHAAGDAVLREFGNFLKRKVRGSDIPCRYGGEEFALVLPEAPCDVTIRRAEQLCEEIPRSLILEHQGQSLGAVTASLGVAFYPEHGSDGEAVLKSADAALYRAKAEGRNRVCIAPPSSPVPT